ncbi:NmrA family NAD(P)-binding protein [Streptomyces sp. NPDC051567]|uniref:NmrA family NAD(P)-binding protein n=1 Tax=Streptomyces sp. NPDC051567 TaxID=3365660 RepID=UPI003790FE68
MIVVMGATGATGSALLERLTALGVPARALSRDPGRLRARLDRASPARPEPRTGAPAGPGAGAIAEAGAGTPAGAPVEVRAADAADPASLRAAFAGASQVFLTMANGPAQVALELNAVTAAVESGVRHLVKLSAPGAGPDSPVAVARGHHTVEEALRTSGIPHTVLRPYAFMQKLLLLAPGVAAHGTVHGAMADAGCNYIDCRDIADVAAAVLTRPELAGHTYTLTGDRTYSHPQLVRLLGDLLGHRVRYAELSGPELHRHLTATARMPGWLASHVVEIQRMATTHPESPDGTVPRLLGRPPRTLETFLREHLDLFRPGHVTGHVTGYGPGPA